MNKRVYIVTDGSKNIGFGHIARCLSFYDKFVEVGYSVELLIDGESNCSELIGNRNCQYLLWHKDITLLQFTHNHIVFLDSLIATQEQTDYMQEIASCFIVIDDFRRRNYKHALIIDWTPNVENTDKHFHNITDGNRLLLGLDYSVLRKPFTFYSCYEIRKLQTVAIIMGGSDLRNLTFPLVEKIRETFPNLTINVVLGPGILDHPKQLNRVVYYRSLSAENVKRLFLESDLVVSAGGQTLFELAALRVPTIPIQIIDNQIEDLSGLQSLGFFDQFFLWDEESLLDKIVLKIRELSSIDARKKYLTSFSGSNIGLGLDKIVNCIQKFL